MYKRFSSQSKLRQFWWFYRLRHLLCWLLGLLFIRALRKFFVISNKHTSTYVYNSNYTSAIDIRITGFIGRVISRRKAEDVELLVEGVELLLEKGVESWFPFSIPSLDFFIYVLRNVLWRSRLLGSF